ncbi:LytR C-terminal domain-containing protein [Frankia sp. AgB1.9]|uniref:LytR C-terminal domain-containing protein n=1 Tax=unclassified Frankia TaxID=2632575 RepID=UPI001933BB4F|nr:MULTISPECIES: LytR C-terminal domain-containing protein [unclassified Frankia]MBL7492359.1 LytR C-terminal domain-containing protein [Frankia sp. AgW1.1]MBL7546986.1 LytR C-terminal domain-containing protein [Frankia sp. AgB1.9]MBL7625119.1 LytR C-terminal domain-containing protein [Frankia sp. AgB1.8]
MSGPGSTTTAARSPASPSPRRPTGNSRLRALGAALIAVLAVGVGILLVNLLHNPKSGAQPPTASRVSTAAPVTSSAPRPTAGAHPTSATSSARPSSPASSPRATTQPPAGAGAVAPVVILNDSKVDGLADAASGPVKAAGFTVDRVGGYVSTYNVPVTTVFYEDDLKAAAQNLQQRVTGIVKIEPITGTDIKLYEPGKLILVVTRDFPTPAP